MRTIWALAKRLSVYLGLVWVLVVDGVAMLPRDGRLKLPIGAAVDAAGNLMEDGCESRRGVQQI